MNIQVTEKNTRTPTYFYEYIFVLSKNIQKVNNIYNHMMIIYMYIKIPNYDIYMKNKQGVKSNLIEKLK